MELVQATLREIERAASLLKSGKLVAFPTETVYGLGGDATNGRAVAAIFAAKGRPSFNPLIVHVPDLAAAEHAGVFGTRARRLAQAFWPGALTVVVARKPGCSITDLATAGLDTIALRVPAHPVAQALLIAVQRPIAAPSANRSGKLSPTRAEHVAADLADEPGLLLDAGPTPHGLESTIVYAAGDGLTMLRPGAVTAEAIEQVLGETLDRTAGSTEKPASPGLLISHYAPRAAVRLNATVVQAGEALLAFGPQPLRTGGPQINLSPAGDMIEAAANLFAALRDLDATGVRAIAVMPIPHVGLGEAINDRLRRAAAPRSHGS